ncbi:efflux RND transporter periplasmic adaptor subunit [bacterium]|nr:efflux RND transporter periplasmic adaptor subunit [candidate division CSSED10-310 bacterium]
MNHYPVKYRLAALAVICLLGIAACRKNTGHPAANSGNTAAPQPIPVETNVIMTGEMVQSLEATGNIQAERDISIYPKISGHVRSIFVEEGDHIKSGQPLCHLDDEELRLRVQQSGVTRRQLEAKYDRVKALHDLNMVSEEEFLDAKFNLETAEVNLQLARLDLSNTRILSPFGGIITARAITVGDLVGPSTRLFDMFDPGSMVVNIYLPESEAVVLRPGIPAEITIDAAPGIMIDADVTRINPAVDPKTGTVKVTLQIQPDSELIKPGMFVRASLVIQKKTGAVLAPKKAIIRSNGRTQIYVMTPVGTAERRDISTGLENREMVEVAGGLQAGERIIVVGQHGLEDGASVYDVRDNRVVPESDESSGSGVQIRSGENDS